MLAGGTECAGLKSASGFCILADLPNVPWTFVGLPMPLACTYMHLSWEKTRAAHVVIQSPCRVCAAQEGGFCRSASQSTQSVYADDGLVALRSVLKPMRAVR